MLAVENEKLYIRIKVSYFLLHGWVFLLLTDLKLAISLLMFVSPVVCFRTDSFVCYIILVGQSLRNLNILVLKIHGTYSLTDFFQFY